MSDQQANSGLAPKTSEAGATVARTLDNVG